ncbi:MAG: hypothetical protein J2P19_00380 [Pseudonocardia sp.]|nr:hypothetical protein [Pseudonocardia sp.]
MTTDLPSTLRHPLPHPEPILAACRAVTAHNFGDAIVGDPVKAPGAVRVRFSSWPRQQEALAVLLRLGYEVAEDDRAGEHGSALIVTGWNAHRLAARADRLDRAVRDLERDAALWADHALFRYRQLVDEDGATEDVAFDRVVDETRTAVAQQPGPRHRHAAGEIDERDRRQETGEIRDLLDRVAAGERTLARLVRDTGSLAEQTIDMYRECRDVHGHDDEAAVGHALTEISEGVRATHDLARAELDDPPSQGAP